MIAGAHRLATSPAVGGVNPCCRRSLPTVARMERHGTRNADVARGFGLGQAPQGYQFDGVKAGHTERPTYCRA
jgi:hypothetical protein